MSISRLNISPTPSNTPSRTPTLTPTQTVCPGICFSGVGTNTFGVVNTILQDVSDPTKMTMVGQFTSLNGVSRNRMVRAYTDGEVDLTFNPGTSFGNPGLAQYPREFVQQGDGKYIVVGSFTSFSAVSRNRIARINYDGTLDTSFVVGTGFTEQTRYAAIDTAGKILICCDGGNQYSGTPVGLLCRLNTDGSLDTTFNNNVITGTTSNVGFKVIRNSDGTYYFSGLFTHSGRSNLIKLNSDGTYASTDPFNTSGIGFQGSANDFEVLSDGKLIVVGDFVAYNGAATPRIIRLNTDGTKDTSFVPGNYSNTQYEVLVQGSKYISVGFAYFYSGIPINNITRINSDGTLDTSWNSGNFTSITTEDLIQHLYQITGATNDAGYIFCAGFFNSYDGVLTNNIVKMDSNGFITDCDPIAVSPTPSNSPTRTPTPSITASPTRTPTLTPTATPTETPCIDCYEYYFTASTSGLLSWLDCDGIMTDTFVNNGDTYHITCIGARQGTVVGTGTIVQGDLCSSTCISPTPTRTSTSTPSVSPTNTSTPTITPTNTTTPSNTPPVVSPSNTPSMTATNTETPTLTPTPTPTLTQTSTPTLTSTQTPSNSPTPSSTPLCNNCVESFFMTGNSIFFCAEYKKCSDGLIYSSCTTVGQIDINIGCPGIDKNSVVMKQFGIAPLPSITGVTFGSDCCSVSPTPTLTQTSTPTITQTNTPSITPSASETSAGGQLFIYGKYIGSSQEVGYTINGGTYLGIGDPGASCDYLTTISGLQINDVIDFMTIGTCAIGGDLSTCPAGTSGCNYQHTFNGTTYIYLTIDASNCC